MNRQATIIAMVLLVTFGAIVSSGVLTSIVLFLLMGSIPGTDYSLPPDIMLSILIGVVTFFTVQTIVKLLRIVYRRKLINELAKRRAQLPRRRYTRAATHS